MYNSRNILKGTEGVVPDDVEYARACQRVREIMSHGHLNMGVYSNDVDVEMWLPEMNNANVTILCDRLLVSKRGIKEGFFAITGEVFRNISILNLEEQSSGFKIVGQYKSGGNEVLLLKNSPKYLKDRLVIPDKEYEWSGFTWWNEEKTATTHTVPVSKYGHRFILNFSVSGEFEIAIYFLPNGSRWFPWHRHPKPKWIFGKSFAV